MGKRLLDFDPEARKQIWHDYDHASKRTTIIEVQDVEPHLKQARALRQYGKTSMGRNEAWRAGMKTEGKWVKVATITHADCNKMIFKDHVNPFNKDQTPELKKLLNRSDYAHTRVATGRV